MGLGRAGGFACGCECAWGGAGEWGKHVTVNGAVHEAVNAEFQAVNEGL